ncbi:phosphatidylinositol-glycan biosynthesis class X protein [Salarias fasciatus]|uniref:Phosphatidylinositol-glycan biosynthesis class X protein n=1 Tax=Salarias fasciatus TaxID=181472 RepID=A0A672G0W7_SALFA|nr:phosphatidylinositol-glycan biosynthesis class X protein [Salarias fasciatus]
MHLLLFSVFASLSTCHYVAEKDENQDHCHLMRQWTESSSVSVELRKNGFHRELVTTVDLRPGAISSVKVLLVHRWPRSVYIDPFQIASLSEQLKLQILLDSAIDLEVPAHKTSGFVTYVYPSYDATPPTLLKVTVPIHGRYHEPSFVGEAFTSVDIEAPELLLRADKCTEVKSIIPHAVVDAPCTFDNSSNCQWVQIQRKQEIGPMSLPIPVGDGSLEAPVCGITLLVTMICCMALSKHMWKHRII